MGQKVKSNFPRLLLEPILGKDFAVTGNSTRRTQKLQVFNLPQQQAIMHYYQPTFIRSIKLEWAAESSSQIIACLKVE